MEGQLNRFLIREYFKLPLFVISGLLKDINILASFKLFINKDQLIHIIKGCFSKCTQSDLLLVYKSLLEGVLEVEPIIETDYFVQYKYTLSRSNPLIEFFNLIINVHHIAYTKVSFVFELIIKENSKLLLKEWPDKLNSIRVNSMIQRKQSKCHQSIILIKCSFDSVKKLLMNYKMFHDLIPECCTQVVLESTKDIVVGDRITMFYSVPDKPSVETLLVATKVFYGKEEIDIILKTEDKGLPGILTHQIEWIAKREHKNQICVILGHTFDVEVSWEFFEHLSNEKKMILNKMKKVLEMQDNQKEKKKCILSEDKKLFL